MRAYFFLYNMSQLHRNAPKTVTLCSMKRFVQYCVTFREAAYFNSICYAVRKPLLLHIIHKSRKPKSFCFRLPTQTKVTIYKRLDIIERNYWNHLPLRAAISRILFDEHLFKQNEISIPFLSQTFG